MSTITIDGKKYNIPNGLVQIDNGKVLVDGQLQTDIPTGKSYSLVYGTMEILDHKPKPKANKPTAKKTSTKKKK
jgi:hypothetical protein